MELKCLSCGEPVSQNTTKLYYRVFVCETCHARIESFVTKTQADLRLLQSMFVQATRRAILNQDFRTPLPDIEGHAGTEVRLSILVSSVLQLLLESAEQCPKTPPSSSIPEAPTQPLLASGESTEPSALTQGADGEKSSSSRTP